MKPFISLCMIVKNEEKVLERCLASVAHLVDEVVIVDTGSTDRTKEIAMKYTSNIFDYDWTNDFSAARNYAASKAAGEWILVLDADEYVDEENFREFINELKSDKDQFDSYYVKILNFTGNYGESLVQNFHDRLYRNNGEIQYYRKIHEQFENITGKPLKNSKSNLLIFHSGYLKNTVSEKNKNQRNKELLDKEMEKESTNAFDYFNLGNEYSSLGEYGKALDSYLEAYKQKKDFRLAWVSTTLIQIIICLINLKRYNDALSVIVDAESMYTNSPEFPYLKGEIFFQRGQLEDAKEILQRILSNTEEYNHIIFRPDLKEQKPHLRLGEIYLMQDNYNDAIYHFTSVLNINKNNSESINKVIYILTKFYPESEIAEFLKLNQLVNENNIPIYVRSCFEIGNPLLAIHLLEEYKEEYKSLSKVALLKNICINESGNINSIKEILQYDTLVKLLESNLINVVDILLIKKYMLEHEDLLTVITSLEQHEQIGKLMSLVDGKDSIINNGSLITYLLKDLLAYKKYDLCDRILDEIEKVDKDTILIIARILFANNFKGEALKLYELAEWDKFVEQDFVNLISSLIQTDNIDGAVNISRYASTTFINDFRFYKYILDYTKDNELYRQTLKDAQERFKGSMYLDKLSL